ncbi:MAG: hypothetical protein LUE96_05450 [Lachnospiraceae bacterium]|nr:hypothetical protein [Lachnospiraceae bacterium]
MKRASKAAENAAKEALKLHVGRMPAVFFKALGAEKERLEAAKRAAQA